MPKWRWIARRCATAAFWRSVAEPSLAASVALVMNASSWRMAGAAVSRSTAKFAVLLPRLVRPHAAIISDWTRLRSAAPVVPSANENVSVPCAAGSLNALAWIDMNRSAPWLLENAARAESETKVSVVRVRSATQLPPPLVLAVSASSSALKRVATSSTMVFSCSPLPTPPGSVPPWPGSMTIRRCAAERLGINTTTRTRSRVSTFFTVPPFRRTGRRCCRRTRSARRRGRSLAGARSRARSR